MIGNIHLLFNHDQEDELTFRQRQMAEELIQEHHQGKHPWGFAKRACPMCQQDKKQGP